MKQFIFILTFLALAGAGKVCAQQKKATAAKAAPASAASISRGQEVYTTLCLACHQADGTGVPHLNPPLTPNPWVAGPKDRLIHLLLNGSQGKVEIDGDSWSNAMPALSYLTDQQIADVLTYVRNSFGNKASGVTAAEVKARRDKN